MDKQTRQKYQLYERAVQSPGYQIIFLNDVFKKTHNKLPLTLREDFCGSACLAAKWVQQSSKHKAVAVDLATEPLDFCRVQHVSKLSRSAQKRLELVEADVRRAPQKNYEVIVAFNFSYFVLCERSELLEYFKNVRKSLGKNGLFFIDFFGGSRVQDERTESEDLGKFVYHWECVAFDPVQNRAMFAIHFKPKGKKRILNAFVYDWRMWSCPELRDILQEAGFSKTTVYWEGDLKDGSGGNGIFKPVDEAENSLIWQSYIVAQK